MGFALFSIFFGAGNLIFPPYLGLESGSAWLLGFICYYLADIGLALICLFAILKCNGADNITKGIGRIPATILMCSIVLCIGPLVAIPRTAATIYEMSIAPYTSVISPLLFSILFFGIVLILSLQKSAVVDIVGKYLTPLLLLGLLFLIVKGILSPISNIEKHYFVPHIARRGIRAGYQTLDVLGTLLFGSLIISSAKSKGYTRKKDRNRIVTLAGLIAGAGLFLTYLGLTYLGATASSIYNVEISRSALILSYCGIFSWKWRSYSICHYCCLSLPHNSLSNR